MRSGNVVGLIVVVVSSVLPFVVVTSFFAAASFICNVGSVAGGYQTPPFAAASFICNVGSRRGAGVDSISTVELAGSPSHQHQQAEVESRAEEKAQSICSATNSS